MLYVKEKMSTVGEKERLEWNYDFLSRRSGKKSLVASQKYVDKVGP
jgi:hypothetical protein